MLLAIDTSGPFCSVALLQDQTLHERSEDIGRGHAERLMGMLDAVLKDAKSGWKNIERIACCTGPGSFTGLRVGIATARGLALALDCPCIGVTVFEAMASSCEGNEPVCIAMDARRDQIWIQNFAGNRSAMSRPQAVAAEEAALMVPNNISRFAGSASPVLASQIEKALIVNKAPSPSISALARVAVDKQFDSAPPKPLYLRTPDAKPQVAFQ